MIIAFAVSLLAADPPKPPTAWTPKDREMVVLLGSAFIEQEARDGYLETELIRLFPNKDIRVRNLGWSGDTVHCQARAYFGPPQEGFDRLRRHLQMIKPTTVICCYGANESWKGEEGIADFRKGYEKLIDMIREATGATVVLMTPPPFVKGSPGIPELKTANERLGRYVQEIGYISESKKTDIRKLWFPWIEEPEEPVRQKQTKSSQSKTVIVDEPGSVTGIDFTSKGYSDWRSPFVHLVVNSKIENPFAMSLWGHIDEKLIIDWEKKRMVSPIEGVVHQRSTDRAIDFEYRAEMLPFQIQTTICIYGAPKASHRLLIDGRPAELIAPQFEHSHDYFFISPDHQQLEKLRQAIVKKNAIFFHRWRPANETYLYGFRKHEQGNNGVEPPMFDKLVEEAEAKIAKLKKPVPHKYELVRVEGGK